MWDFIKYCLYCMGITISAAFGYNPSNLTWKTGITGMLTAVALFCFAFSIVYLVYFIMQRTPMADCIIARHMPRTPAMWRDQN